MWNSEASGGEGTGDPGSGGRILDRYYAPASVNDDLIAAVEGWRRAHGIAEQPEALGELVRLGLMSEVAKIYRLVCQDGHSSKQHPGADRKPQRHQRSKRSERREHDLTAN